MHRSRFAGIIIDCQTEDIEAAGRFWSEALGYPAGPPESDGRYVSLDVPDGETYAAVQAVEHASRVHLDIETDDIDAEVSRLEALGAKRLGAVRSWVVMEAPTGQRFCVVQVTNAHFEATANTWDDE